MATKTAPPVGPVSSFRFFSWMRSLGITREPGWIGGVCAGLATRLGIDPLIVRGIVVVLAVLGAPALLLYAAAWLLLPDTKDAIHLEQLIRGRFESAIAGIGALVLLSLLPVTQGIWYAGAAFWGEPSWRDSAGRVVWTLIVLSAVVAFVVWVARRSTPATTDDRPETAPQPVAPTTLVEPTPPPADAKPEDLEAWREQQAAWKAEREAFRAETAASAKETARQRAEEARARIAAAALERAEQRERWRAANPRAGAAYGAIALGGAALAGGVAALVSPVPQYAPTMGLAVAAVFLGLAIAVAGILRRRSGFLSFVSVLVLIGMLVSALIPADRTLLPPGQSLSNAAPGRYAVPLGSTSIRLERSIDRGGVIDVWQGSGTANVFVGKGVTARIELATPGEAWLCNTHSSTACTRLANHSSTVLGAGTDPTITVRISQRSGSIFIQDSSTPTTGTDTAP